MFFTETGSFYMRLCTDQTTIVETMLLSEYLKVGKELMGVHAVEADLIHLVEKRVLQ